MNLPVCSTEIDYPDGIKVAGKHNKFKFPSIMEMAAVDFFGWFTVMEADMQIKNYNVNRTN